MPLSGLRKVLNITPLARSASFSTISAFTVYAPTLKGTTGRIFCSGERAPWALAVLASNHAPMSSRKRLLLEHFSVDLPEERARRQYGDRCRRSRSPSRSDGGDPAAIPNTENAEAT